jgi:hypothetical protein
MAQNARRKPPFSLISWLGSAVVWFFLFLGALWAFGALWFDFPFPSLRHVAAGLFALLVIGIPVRVHGPRRAKLTTAAFILAVFAWWLTLQPQQDRDWMEEVAIPPHAEIDGDIVTVHNVRNFDYRTETDFIPHRDVRRLDLRNLRGADLFINFWGSPFMAHPIASFDFGPDGRIAFSIETRPEKGEAFSALGGFYRQFELAYVVADERDVIRVRTNFRKGEDVYLYRLKSVDARRRFMEFIQTANELHANPRWYNAVTNNCTTAIRQQRTTSERAPWDWRMLVNGFGAELLYERGAIDTSMPFAELRKLSHINARAVAAGNSTDFSDRIRVGLPGMTEAP